MLCVGVSVWSTTNPHTCWIFGNELGAALLLLSSPPMPLPGRSGLGMNGIINAELALIRLGQITFSTPLHWNCAPVVGSKIGISAPVLPFTKSVKLPVFSRAVGTWEMPSFNSACLYHSWL